MGTGSREAFGGARMCATPAAPAIDGPPLRLTSGLRTVALQRRVAKIAALPAPAGGAAP